MRELTYLQRVIVMIAIVGTLVFLVFGISQTPGQSSPERLEYYGVDAAAPDDWEWLASQGVNAVFLGMSGYGVGSSFYQQAREAGVRLFVWPLGSGEQYTPWHWNGGNSWDISEGEPLLRELVQNHDVVIAVMSLHEPYWRGGQGPIPSESQKALADEIRAYTRSQGHELEILNLVNSVHYWQDDPVIPGQFDWAGIWLHCWDAEGTEEQAREWVRLDRQYIDAHGLDVKLVFLVQAFGIDGTDYRMPTYEELRSLSCDILGQDALEGFLYYSWGQAGGHYTDWLKNHPEMHGVIKDVYDNCVEIVPPSPTGTPEPTSTATPTNTPTATPTTTPTDVPAETPESTSTATPTNTPTATPTTTPTDVSAETPESTSTATPTNTPTATPTTTPTDVPAETPESTSTATPTNTPTATPTSTPTDASTPNATAVPDEIVYLPVVLR